MFRKPHLFLEIYKFVENNCGMYEGRMGGEITTDSQNIVSLREKR